MRWFLDRPWLLAVLAFIILISAWITLFIIAGKNLPEPVEIQSAEGVRPLFVYESGRPKGSGRCLYTNLIRIQTTA
ncbi:MAG: hypothetical protein DRP71_06610 [Verrucomicrobia bacterium]|nr:MAG: hypothetical protein DRP71_06610 [Verrucomicrobiota bacterium]